MKYNDIWVFSTLHKESDHDTAKKYTKNLRNRTDLARLFYGTMKVRNNQVTKGLVWFEKPVTRDLARKEIGTDDIIAVDRWDPESFGFGFIPTNPPGFSPQIRKRLKRKYTQHKMTTTYALVVEPRSDNGLL